MSPVAGTGNRKSEQRNLPAFHRIDIRLAARVKVEVGRPQRVTVEIDDNLLGLIVTEVKDETLLVTSRDKYLPKEDLYLGVSLSDLAYFGVAGSVDAEILGARGRELRIELQGSATLRATGAVDRLDLEIEGAGANIALFDLQAKEASVSVAGAGNVKVTATESLSATVAGVGRVKYRGNPKRVEKHVYGLGTVSPD